MTGETPSPLDGDPITTLRETVDTLHADFVDYNKCRLCPLGADSVCFPNCAEWKIGKAALAQVEALAEAAQAANGVIYALPKAARTERRRKVGGQLHAALAPFAAHKDTNHA